VWQILNDTSAQLGYTVPFTLVPAQLKLMTVEDYTRDEAKQTG